MAKVRAGSFLVMLSLMFCTVPRQEAGRTSQRLFADEPWYSASEASEQTFDGVLMANPEVPARPTFHRVNRYVLNGERASWEVYTGGHDDGIEAFAGRRIRLIGKAVETNVEGRVHREIWPARLEAEER
jgi:hypothetical protein